MSLFGILGTGLLSFTAQPPASSRPRRSRRAAAYERTLGPMPHQYLDRTEGDTDELPPRFSVGLLSKIHRASWFCRFARGKNLLDRWGQKTAAELIARFQETVDNPYFKFRDMNDETPVNISAYVLQVDGAKSGT
jgi:hypothetical protein